MVLLLLLRGHKHTNKPREIMMDDLKYQPDRPPLPIFSASRVLLELLDGGVDFVGVPVRISANPARQLHILRHDRHSLGMQRAQTGIKIDGLLRAPASLSTTTAGPAVVLDRDAGARSNPAGCRRQEPTQFRDQTSVPKTQGATSAPTHTHILGANPPQRV